MNEVQMQAIAAIEKQQEGRKRDAAWKAGGAALQAEAEKFKAEAEKRLAEAAAAAESAKKAKEKLKKLQENPEVPAEVLDKLKGEAAEEAQKALEAARAEAEAKVKAAEMAAQAAAQRAEEAEKKLRTADAETAAFKARFVDIQNAFATLRRMKDEATDPDKAAGMQRAVQALLERERRASGSQKRVKITSAATNVDAPLRKRVFRGLTSAPTAEQT